jgi:uncharacterized membrane protein
MSFGRSITGLIRNRFISGLLIIVPLVISYQVLSFLLAKLDGLLSPVFSKYLGYEIPGLGILVTLLIVLLVGFVAHSVIGGKLIRTWEGIIERIPLVRTVYIPAKQLLKTITPKSESSFKRVALVEYPRKNVWVIGFLATDVDLTSGGIEGDYRAVFIASTPTPFTGFMAMIPREDIHPIDMPVEEAIKFLVSGGVACPKTWLPSVNPTGSEVS